MDYSRRKTERGGDEPDQAGDRMALTKAKPIGLIGNGDIDVGGGLSNPMPDTTLIANLNADLLDGVHLADIRLGQNILHNWDFRNPVNQRELLTYPSQAGARYTIDRWANRSWYQVTTVNTGYITILNDYSTGQPFCFSQIVEIPFISDAYTFSVELSSGEILATQGTLSTAFGAIGVVEGGSNTTEVTINLNANTAVSLRRAKLELGTVSTLHLDPPMDWAVELPKCQRYYERLGAGMYFLAYTATSVIASSPFTVYKRITPSFSLLIGTMMITDGLADYTATTLTASIYSGDNKGMRQVVLSGFAGLTVGNIYYCGKDYYEIIGVSADL